MDPYTRLIRIQEELNKKKVGPLSSEEKSLFKQMKKQNAEALARTRAQHGSDIVPQPKGPKPISFR